MRYFLYIIPSNTYQEIDENEKKYLEKQMSKKMPFKWQGMRLKPSQIRIFNEKQYRMLKGWDLNDENDRKEVEEYFKRMKELTKNFDGDLSYYGEVLDEKKKWVKNDILGGEIGLILLAEEMGAICKKGENWVIKGKDGKTAEWNYFYELKRALKAYEELYTYKDEEWERENKAGIEAIKERLKAKFQLSTLDKNENTNKIEENETF